MRNSKGLWRGVGGYGKGGRLEGSAGQSGGGRYGGARDVEIACEEAMEGKVR